MLFKKVEIELQMPQEILEVELAIKEMIEAVDSECLDFFEDEIEFKEYVVAGGSVCDWYMSSTYPERKKLTEKRFPFKDVDIFIKDTYFKPQILENILGISDLQTHEFESHYKAVLGCEKILRFNYKGIQFELCFVKSMFRVETFDFAFRNFFYKEGKVFTTEQALKDIKTGVLTVQSCHTPVTSLIRGLEFEERYGFVIDDRSMDWIKFELLELNKNTIIDNIMFNFDKKKFRNEESKKICKTKLEAFLVGRTVEKINNPFSVKPKMMFQDSKVVYPFHEKVDEIIQNDRYIRGFTHAEILDKMQSFEPVSFIKESKRFNMVSRDELMDLWSRIEVEIDKELKTYCMKECINKDNTSQNETLYEFTKLSLKEKVDLMELGTGLMYEGFMEWIYDKQVFESEARKDIKQVMVNMPEISFSYQSGQTRCLLDNNVIVVHVKTAANNLRMEFRKVVRGIYTLSGLISQSSSLIGGGEYLVKIMKMLKEWMPDVFDLGEKGDIALNNPNANSQFFQYGVLV